MITQISYERVFNLGSYESERISAVASVEDGDIDAAYNEARMAVESEHARTLADRKAPQAVQPNSGASYAEAPASDKQRNFVATLQDKLGWNSEQLLVYASAQDIDLARMTKSQASTFIDGLKRIADKHATEAGIVKWAEHIVSVPVADDADIPF